MATMKEKDYGSSEEMGYAPSPTAHVQDAVLEQQGIHVPTTGFLGKVFLPHSYTKCN